MTPDAPDTYDYGTRPGWFTRLLWACAGADEQILLRCPNTDRVKFQGLGGVVGLGHFTFGESIEDHLVGAVDLVPDQVQPGVVEVGADLVLAPGAGVAGHERNRRSVRRPAPPQHLEPGPRREASLGHVHPDLHAARSGEP